MGRDSILMKSYEQQAHGKIPDFRRGINANDDGEPLTGKGEDDEDYQRA